MTDPKDLLRLGGLRLDATLGGLDVAERYYRGRSPVSFIAPEVLAETQGRLRQVVMNLSALACDALAERLTVTGFRQGDAETPDPALWGLWRASSLDSEAALAHRTALSVGRCGVLVWAGADGAPVATIESPRRMWVEIDPLTRQPAWAVRRLLGADGYATAGVFQADVVTVLRSRTAAALDPVFGPWLPGGQSYGLTAVDYEVTAEIANPLGEVPAVLLANRTDLDQPFGTPESRDLWDCQDALAKVLSDMMTTSEYLAAPRRWATGVQLPTDENGDPVEDVAEVQSAKPGRTWLLEDPAAKVGQFPGADMAGFVASAELLERIAGTLGSLPPHYMALAGRQGEPASADAIRAAEASLVSKAIDRQGQFGRGWAQVARLMSGVRDGLMPDPGSIEVVWSSPETRTSAEDSDAATKLASIGVPLSALLPRLGFSPTEVETITSQRHSDALLQAGLGGLGAMP